MDRRIAVVIALVTIAIGVILFGLVTGDQGTYAIDVGSVVAQQELPDNAEVVEFDYLSPAGQDAFLNALESGERVHYDGSGPRPTAVHYRDQYYRVGIVVGAASKTTMFFAIFGGLVSLCLAAIVWKATERQARR